MNILKIKKSYLVLRMKAENKGKEIIIEARNFTYDKVLNILNANKNVKIIDSVQNVIIDAEDITYLRNKEKIFTKGKTKAVVENNYKFYSKNVSEFCFH